MSLVIPPTWFVNWQISLWSRRFRPERPHTGMQVCSNVQPVCPSRVTPSVTKSHKRELFTARRNARIASTVLPTAIPSVRLSVCPSFTHWYCSKTTARSMVQFALSDSKMCLVLQKPKNIPEGRPLPLKSWLKVTHPLLKAERFDMFCLVACQQ